MPLKSSRPENVPTPCAGSPEARPVPSARRVPEQDAFTAMMDSAIEADLGEQDEPDEAEKRRSPSGSAVAILLAAGWGTHTNDAMLTAGQEFIAGAGRLISLVTTVA